MRTAWVHVLICASGLLNSYPSEAQGIHGFRAAKLETEDGDPKAAMLPIYEEIPESPPLPEVIPDEEAYVETVFPAVAVETAGRESNNRCNSKFCERCLMMDANTKKYIVNCLDYMNDARLRYKYQRRYVKRLCFQCRTCENSYL